MEKVIPDLVGEIWLGNNVEADVCKLRKYGSVVLDIVLGFSEEKIQSYPQLPKNRHPYDAYDDVNHLVFEISKDSKTHYLELLKLSFQGNKDCIFALTWIAGPLGFEESIDYLIMGLKHKNKDIRWSCSKSLKYYFDKKIKEAFIDALKDRCSDVRFNALEGLFKYKDKNILPFISPSLKDKYPGIRALADELIKSIEKQ